jgi:hypothetical protein
MISAFGVDHALIAKSTQKEQEQHYGRMAGIMGATGVGAGGIATGSGIIAHLERKGHDPMGFAEEGSIGKVPKAKERAAILAENMEGHKWQAKVGSRMAAGALGLAGAYKGKQLYTRRQARRQQQVPVTKADRKQWRHRGDVASNVGLDTASAGLAGAGLVGGMKMSHVMNQGANERIEEGRLAHHALAARKLGEKIQGEGAGEEWLPHEGVTLARQQRKVAMRVGAVKKPAAIALGGISALGGAGLYEVGRHAAASRKKQS